VREELFLQDGRTNKKTDVTKIIVAFRNFAKASNKDKLRDFRFLLVRILSLLFPEMIRGVIW
jgi:hypothetical protein